jgi:class 3 adenylate cyclase
MPLQAQGDALAIRRPSLTAGFFEFIAGALPQRFGGDRLLREIEKVLAGARPQRRPERVLATVLFTDIVGSTLRVARLGDRRWRRVLEAHDVSVRSHVAAHGGRVLKSLGDGYLATFDRPARAVLCGHAIGADARALGLCTKAGVHTGECERIGDDVAGIAVHIGARVMAQAAPGEVLATSVVRDLVVGSGIEFADRGPHELRGVPGVWRLHAAAR